MTIVGQKPNSMDDHRHDNVNSRLTRFLSLRGLLNSSKHAVTKNAVFELLLRKQQTKKHQEGERHYKALNPQKLRERGRAHNLHLFSTLYAAQFYILFNLYNNPVK